MEVAVGFHGREAINVLFDAANVETATPRKQEEPDQAFLSPNSKSSLSTASSGVWRKIKVMLDTRPKATEDAVAEYAVSFASQVECLFLRCLKTTTRDLWLLYFRGGAHIFVGLFMGVFFFDMGEDATRVFHNVGSVFFTILFLIFASMLPTTVTYPLEIHVLLKEILNKWYSLKAYYLAKTLSDIPFSLIYSLIYLALWYFMSSQPMDAHRFLRFLALSAFVSIICQSLGLMIGTVFPIQTAVFVGPVVAAPFLIFSGFFLSVKAIPQYMRWVSHISFLKYYFEGTMFCIYGYNRSDLLCNQPFCQFKNPDMFLRELDLEENVYWLDFWVLVLYNVVLRVVAYYVIRWKLHHSQ
ncbi:unnamed protein product [Darwinula stevensoni]|uniref:ABC-2 type transporter transmembrane domain-containing protein n=1 Tax=Darwinula stevensoni TaxID=69355 RepID=A0A7R9ADH8_9CRUS|nr:unnamed protein product [Darwinula stevensoni]CAG0901336.1 unnamed protein product [Darwinula stevensoni]